MKNKRFQFYMAVLFFSAIILFIGCSKAKINQITFNWPNTIERSWVGPYFWANRLQDWHIKDGWLECLSASEKKPMRTVHLLTRRAGNTNTDFEIKIQGGKMDQKKNYPANSAFGFLIGAGGNLDYRAASLIHHSYGKGGGLFFGIDGEGKLFIQDFEQENHFLSIQPSSSPIPENIELHLKATYKNNQYTLVLKSRNALSGKSLDQIQINDFKDTDRLIGNIAFVSHPGTGDSPGRFKFKYLMVSGQKIEIYEDRNCGPILSTQYTLSKNILKLTAQMMPIASSGSQEVLFEVFKGNQWQSPIKTKIIVPGYTATFKIDNWDSNTDSPYRVSYDLFQADGTKKTTYRNGIIRHNPIEKEEIRVAAFTGNHNTQSGVDRKSFPWSKGIWFPHTDIIGHIQSHQPDFLFFSGDQVYEGASPTDPDRDQILQDYLYKWYLWCWAFRDLTADIPAVTIPDDHDVYHGNVWGAGGKPTKKGTSGAEAQDSGGYKHSPEFVKMVERTQTSHLPDPSDPTPVLQGIGVYYCDVNYGGISFAVIEDRKFKSAPKALLPKAKIRNGWKGNPLFDSKNEADIKGAKLLGDRQLDFLDHWASDWTNGTWMKVVLSQTLFSNIATIPKEAKSGSVIPTLPIMKSNYYAENDRLVADMDSNGWPQSGRNRALRLMRKGFAVHISGDQHLGSTIQYGIDDWNDASFALCVPSIANFWPRRWYPPYPGKNHKHGDPLYTGDYEDGFGNKMTVFAVSNPVYSGKEPSKLHDRSPGYGIVKFFRTSRKIVFENWPRWADPSSSGDRPYPGWPVEFDQQDNYGKKAMASLPVLKINGMDNPVIQVIHEQSKEIVYTIRANSPSYQPKVFKKGTYTLKIGEPGTSKHKILTHIKTLARDEQKEINIDL